MGACCCPSPPETLSAHYLEVLRLLQWLCAGGFVTCRLQTLAQRADGVDEVALLVVAPGLLNEDGLAPCFPGLSDDVPVVVQDIVCSRLLPRGRAEAVQQLGLTSSIDPFKALIKGGYGNTGPSLERW